jgi:hypothetical protein
MSERRPPRNTKYEGPAELIQAGVPENNVFDGKGMPGGRSFADHLTDKYGEEGTGWGIDAEQFASENYIKDELHAVEFDAATQAFNSLTYLGRYALEDGKDVTGKVFRYARQPDKVNVVKYPDGAIHQAEQEKDRQ